MAAFASDEPRTVREVHEAVGEPAGLTRDQTEYRLQKLEEQGELAAKKSPGRTGPQIFWRD